MINLVPAGSPVNSGQVYHYRHHLDAGQPMTSTVHPRSGDSNLYVWTPGNAFAGDEQVTFVTPEAGVYLIEVRGYSDAVYALDLTAAGGPEMTVASLG